MFLTDEDLYELTGYRQAARQIAMLKQQRIPFHCNKAGKPKVACAVIEGRKAVDKVATASTWSPSWAANPQ